MNKYIVKTVKAIGSVPVVRRTLEKMFPQTFLRYKQKERADAFHQYGLESLRRFDECMTQNGYQYSMAFGSLLGAVREHGFIKHDLDIDIWMWKEDADERLIQVLESAGFKLLYSYSIADGKYGLEYTFDYHGVHIDVFFIYPAVDEHPYCCDFVERKQDGKYVWMPRRMQFPIVKQLQRVPFESLQLTIPENAVDLCKYFYGPTYMVPDPNWNWASTKKTMIEWTEVASEVVHQHHR